MGDDRSAQSWDLVWRNTYLLVLLMAAAVALTGVAAGVLDFFTASPALSVPDGWEASPAVRWRPAPAS